MPVVLRTAEEAAAAWMNYKIEKGSVWKTVVGVHQRLKSENACTRKCKKVQGGAAGEGEVGMEEKEVHKECEECKQILKFKSGRYRLSPIQSW